MSNCRDEHFEKIQDFFVAHAARPKLERLPIDRTVQCPYCLGSGVGMKALQTDGTWKEHPCSHLASGQCVGGRMDVRTAVLELLDLHIFVEGSQGGDYIAFDTPSTLELIKDLIDLLRGDTEDRPAPRSQAGL